MPPKVALPALQYRVAALRIEVPGCKDLGPHCARCGETLIAFEVPPQPEPAGTQFRPANILEEALQREIVELNEELRGAEDAYLDLNEEYQLLLRDFDEVLTQLSHAEAGNAGLRNKNEELWSVLDDAEADIESAHLHLKRKRVV